MYILLHRLRDSTCSSLLGRGPFNSSAIGQPLAYAVPFTESWEGRGGEGRGGGGQGRGGQERRGEGE